LAAIPEERGEPWALAVAMAMVDSTLVFGPSATVVGVVKVGAIFPEALEGSAMVTLGLSVESLGSAVPLEATAAFPAAATGVPMEVAPRCNSASLGLPATAVGECCLKGAMPAASAWRVLPRGVKEGRWKDILIAASL